MGVGMKLNWEFDLGEEKLDELALEVDVPEGLANDPGLAEDITGIPVTLCRVLGLERSCSLTFRS